MRYLQVKGGQKLHIVLGTDECFQTPPLCGRKLNNPRYTQGFRMIINVPLKNACKITKA